MTGVLLYNLDREKLLKIKFILFKLGLAAREISPAEFGHPIGYLAGLEGFAPAEEPGVPFAGEMLVSVVYALGATHKSRFLNR